MPLDLIIGPARSGKKKVILERFVARLKDDPFLLVPNETDAGYIRWELLKITGAAIGANIISYDKFIDRLAKKAGISSNRINTIQQEFIIGRIIGEIELTALAGSSKYAGFCKAIISLFGGLKEGMNTPRALEAAFDKWAGASYRSINYLSDILELYKAYLDELDRLDLIDEQLIRWKVAEALSNGEPLETNPIFMYGFDDFTTSQRQIIDGLKPNADITLALTYADTDAFAEKRALIEALIKSSSNLTRVGEDSPDCIPGAPGLATKTNFLVSAGERGEIELAGAKILELIRKHGFRPDDIAVIARDFGGYARTIARVFEDFGIPYSFNEPAPYSHSALGRAVLSLLKFCYTSGDVDDLITYLRIRYSDKQGLIDRFEREVRLKKITGTRRITDEWMDASGMDIGEIDGLLGADRFSEMMTQLQAVGAEVLNGIITSDSGLDDVLEDKETSLFTSSERASLAAFSVLENSLKSLGELEAADSSLSPRPDEVYEILLNSEVRVGREAETGRVHVLRVHRARGRSYRAVFILGLNEGRFPKSISEDPFLDLEERRQLSSYGLQLKTEGGGIAEERYLFYVATTRATEELFLSYQSVNDDGKDSLKSSFVIDLQGKMEETQVKESTVRHSLTGLIFDGRFVPIPNAKEAIRFAASRHRENPALAKSVAGSIDESLQLESAVDKTPKSEARFAYEKAKRDIAGRETFNVTELESFLNCPFKWYIERVLKPQSIKAELDSLNKGSILHSTLEKFYRVLPGRFGVHRPVKEKLDEMEKLVLSIFEEIFERDAVEKDSIDAQFMRYEMGENLKRFIRAEAGRQTGFRPRFFEATFGLPAGEYNDEHKKDCLVLDSGIKIRGKIDRIDVDDDGGAIIIDYKTKSIHGIKEIESGKSLQVPLYIEAVKKLWGLNPVAGGYLSIAKGTADGIYNKDAIEKTALQANAAREGEEFEAIISSALGKACEAAESIKKGEFAPRGEDNSCKFCELGHICRKERI